MVTSSGAGIQPINAIRKATSVVSLGNIWVKGMVFAFLVYARITAAIVLMVRVIIIIFISISNSLNRPISKTSKQITVIRILHIAGFEVIPKS